MPSRRSKIRKDNEKLFRQQIVQSEAQRQKSAKLKRALQADTQTATT
jgi:hypothetical protein